MKCELGNSSVLDRYDKERRLKNLPMMLGVDGLKRIFSVDPSHYLWAAAKNTGMSFINISGPFKVLNFFFMIGGIHLY